MDGLLGRLGDLVHQGPRAVPLEREPAGKDLVEEDPDAVPVARFGADVIQELFRGHVGRSPRPSGHAVREVLRRIQFGGEAEVQQDHASLGGHQHIAWLDVLVEQACLVEGLQPLAQVTERPGHQPEVRRRRHVGEFVLVGVLHVGRGREFLDGRALDRREGLGLERGGGAGPAFGGGDGAQELEDVGPLDQLHGEEPLAVVGDQLVEAHEVRVADVGQRPELLLEEKQASGSCLMGGLEGHDLLPLPVVHFVDRPERARTETASVDETGGSLEWLHLRASLPGAGREDVVSGLSRQLPREPASRAAPGDGCPAIPAASRGSAAGWRARRRRRRRG